MNNPPKLSIVTSLVLGDYMEGAMSRAIGLVAYLGGPRLCHSGHAKHVSPGSQGFAYGGWL